MKTKTFFASLAVAGLLMAQPLAAATRSYESLPAHGVQSAQAADRVGSIGTEAEALKGSPIALIGILFVVLAGLLVLAGNSGGGGDRTPINPTPGGPSVNPLTLSTG